MKEKVFDQKAGIIERYNLKDRWPKEKPVPKHSSTGL